MQHAKHFFINGEWVAPSTDATIDVIDPSTEEVTEVIALGAQADTDAAVAAAKAAFPAWAATPVAERIRLVERLRDVYVARKAEMGEAIRREMGSPKQFAHVNQVEAGTWHWDGFLQAMPEMHFETPLASSPKERILLEPIGVCALITPWNWPMNQIVLKAIPAMLMGNTMVLKPSEIAPLSGLLFAEMVEQAGIPAGVFNLVNGDGAGVGSQLSCHPDVDMVSFTGSSRAGIAISKAAADTLKRVSLELGGKGANIIFADADPNAVISGTVRCFRNVGQSCNAPTRMLVEASRYEEAVAQATKAAQDTRVAPSLEDGDHIGPLVSQAQFDKVQGLIEKGIAEGAKLMAGGLGRPDGLNRGYFARPTVFADVTPEMSIYRDEIFGPVLSILPFKDEAEAIAIANDTPYGLTNYIQTSDTDKRRRVARAVRSGMVETNGQGFGVGSPFGGFKQSGNGREGGKWGLHEFAEVKAVSGWDD